MYRERNIHYLFHLRKGGIESVRRFSNKGGGKDDLYPEKRGRGSVQQGRGENFSEENPQTEHQIMGNQKKRKRSLAT